MSNPIGKGLADKGEQLITDVLNSQPVQAVTNTVDSVRQSINQQLDRIPGIGYADIISNEASRLANQGFAASPMGIAEQGLETATQQASNFLNVDPRILGLSVGLFQTVKGRRKVADRQGANVAKYLKQGGDITTLRNRDFNAASATNYSLSNQIDYQIRYGESRRVGAQAHHIGNHQLWGQAMNRADSPVIDKILTKNSVVKGNDALNMIDAPGWESKKSGIFGKDHGLIHDLYESLPTYREVKQYLQTGSWDRLSPKQAASRLIALAREQDDIVIRWANWKIDQIYRNHPELKVLPPTQLRKWAEQNPQEFARMGSMAKMPTYKQLMKAPKRYNNEMLRTLFGLQRGNKSGVLPLNSST